MKKIIIATKNKGKLAELEAPLKELGFEVGILPENYPDIIEDGETFEENALIKARFVCKDFNMPALADDSGLCVQALNNAPGIYSARYAFNYPDLASKETQDKKNNRKLLDVMQTFKGKERACAFHCAMALVFPNTQNTDDIAHNNTQNSLLGKEIIVHETWEGILLEKPCGDYGFGYDPLFFDEELQCSSAQMPKDIKMVRSHRAKALKTLFATLKKHLA